MEVLRTRRSESILVMCHGHAMEQHKIWLPSCCQGRTRQPNGNQFFSRYGSILADKDRELITDLALDISKELSRVLEEER